MRSQAVALRIADARDAVPTLPAAVGAFLKQCEAKGLSAATVHFYRQRLETFARRAGLTDPSTPLGAGLAALTPDLVRSYLVQEREATSPATARHGWSALSAFSQFLTGEGYLSENPMQQVARPKVPTKLVKPRAQAEVEKLLEAANAKSFVGARLRAVVFVLVDCGLRASELCGLDLDDVNWNEGTLTVMGKGAKERAVLFGRATRQALMSYLTRRGEHEGQAALFLGVYGTRLNRDDLHRLLKAAATRAEGAGAGGPGSAGRVDGVEGAALRICRRPHLCYNRRRKGREMSARYCRALIVAVVALGAAAWVGSLGAQPDDAFITYQYAKRLAAGEGFTFSPGAPPTYGATSPLWTLTLAGAARLGAAPHLSAPWLTALCHAAAAGLLAIVGGAWTGLGWALAFIPLVYTNGMETSLLMALMLLAVLLVHRNASPPLLGFVGGLVVWTRPEGALFVLALAAAAANWRRATVVVLTATAAYLPWAVYAWRTFGDLLPLSARAKMAMRWWYPDMTLSRTVSHYFPGDFGLLVFAACVALAAAGAWWAWREERRWLPFIAWALAYAIALRAARAPDFFWYAVPPAWLVLLLAVRGLRGSQLVAGGRRVPVAAVLVACLALVGWQGIAGFRVPREKRSLHQDLAQFVGAHARPGDLVAAQEVGNLAYWTDLPMLDLLSVTSAETLPEVQLGRADREIERWQPAFVVTFNDRGEWRRNYRLLLTRWVGPRKSYTIWQHE